MSTNSQSLLPRRSSVPKARTVLKPPERPIALRREYITDTKTLLTLNPQGGSNSSKAYTILDDEGAVMFTVTGWKFSDRSCREFRDASGLPLFELHRTWFKFRHKWCVTLPGVMPGRGGSSSGGGGFGDSCNNGGVLATGSHRIRALGYKPCGGFSIGIERNAAAADIKKEDDKKLTLNIERYGNVLALFDVVDGDRKVAQVRESIEHNERLALISSRADYRPVFDVIVTSGVDLSLIAIIAVIASDSVFTANIK